MSVTDLLFNAGVTRILMVDDDLRGEPLLSEVNECATVAPNRVEAILNDPDHDATEQLIELLEQADRPRTSVADLFKGLADAEIRRQCPDDLREPYETALANLRGFQEPLRKIQSWVRAHGRIELTTWSSIKELAVDEYYDLLIVDYYLTANEAGPTRAFIRGILEKHKDRAKPLLVVLMSSDKEGVTSDLSIIRDEVGASASRFRILVKPTAAHAEPEAVVKERWLQALTQLANERALIQPIEGFIEAWKTGLMKATDTIIKRLYELDASAFAILSATAGADSMSIEEYMADVLAKRVSAETEEHSEVSSHTQILQDALLSSLSTVGPTINQGVEIKHAQHAIRRLMSDVVWHRSPWHQPQMAPPLKTKKTADSSATEAAVTNEPAPASDGQDSILVGQSEINNIPTSDALVAQEAASTEQPDQTNNDVSGLSIVAEEKNEPVEIAGPETFTGVTQERLTWMKRHLRFGTVLREKTGLQRYFVNITQACDVQNVKLDAAHAYHYLFVRGEKLAVDHVAVGEKVFESPYYAQSSTVDQFFSFQWNLRQPYTPSMTKVLERLEDYTVEGQLRNESAYAVLAKFLSQASRVALLRMPKIYRCPVYILHKNNETWITSTVENSHEIHASCWEKKPGVWCSQFQLDDAYRIVSSIAGLTPEIQAKSVAALGKSTPLDTKKNHAIKKLDGNRVYIARLKPDADLELNSVIESIQPSLKGTQENDVVVVIKTADGFM